MNGLLITLLFILQPAQPTQEEAPTSDAVRASIQGGVDYLLKSQNQDGSWGGVKDATFCSGFADPGTYHCWMVGTTALAIQALLQLGKSDEAHLATDRGLDYLVAHARLIRPAEWDVDNNWGLVYGLNTLALAIGHPRYMNSEREKILRKAGQVMLEGLVKYQSPRGGWGYYANPGARWRPEWATSFTTAVGLMSLVEARRVGLDVDDKMFNAARSAVERSHLPNGAYNYDVSAFPRHMRMESINQVKGSLGRIQVGNLSLHRSGGKLKEGDLEWGIEQFFKHHKFLDVARNRPIPHEAYYANAAYFYFFGHYYASMVIQTIDSEKRLQYEQRLQREIMKCQSNDGSMWDFWIASNSKPYGTSFGIMALANTLPAPD